MFLIDKLPKESEKSIAEPITKSAQLEKLVSSAVATQISKPWLPYYCHKKRSKFDVRTKKPFSSVHIKNLAEGEEQDEGKFSFTLRDEFFTLLCILFFQIIISIMFDINHL